ncbi:MAG: thiol reductant ABC exporter subunit CydD [Solirubrobacteraceae bacterium]
MSGARRGVVDPRLLRYARATRPFLVVSVLLGALAAALVIAQAWLLADVIAGALGAGRGVAAFRVPLAALLIVVVARAAVSWCREALASRCSALVKSQLRAELLEHAGALGPVNPGARRTGELAMLATQGIDALDGYFSLYIPQLLLAVIVPVAVLAVVLDADWISALIILGTLPLIPLFMALVGANTRDRVELQLRTLERLAGHFLDVVTGLVTLKVFGRAKAQIATIGEVTDRYRSSTMSTLRVAFLSSMILELVATISVALVAVAVGVRLMGGHLGLRSSLMVLVLAPEAYLPLRQLGSGYHAGKEALAAADQVFAVLELPLPPRGRGREIPDPALTGLSVSELVVEYPGREQPALNGVSLTVEPGEIVAITGSSGCGKSTLLAVLLGFLTPQAGSVCVGDVDLTDLDPDAWRAMVSWLPQRPHLFAASIEDNIRLGRPGATSAEVARAVVAAGLSEVVAGKPDGLDTMLGDRGGGLSVGERQRVALARAFLRPASLLLLDEPTANLDGASEDEVISALEGLTAGRTVVIVAHRPALVGLADRVLELGAVAVPV